MSMHGAATPAELSVLRKALDDCCRELGVADDSPVRERLAARIMSLFNEGALSADLKEALAADRQH
ncbi:hypothetical protein NKG95_28300 [Mesorhizobium sp. M1423]|jgi:hypothetical protein|uniref:hypothetical protein n=1 Tax=unclassified Mesorhizobium TaxID=325217 RepID=UPI00333BDAB4